MRTLVPLLAAAAVLAPGAAWAQTSAPSPASSPVDCSEVPEGEGGCASPSPSPSPTANCPHVEFSADRYVITSGEVVTITARRVVNAPDQEPPSATLTRRKPQPVTVVRSDTGTATIVTWPLRLGESHDFHVEHPATGRNCFPLGRPNGMSLSVEVAPVLTIDAHRAAPRQYTFSGRVQPARAQTVTLYRHTSTGARVLTAQGTVRPDGTYSIGRRFTGSGRFGFSAAVTASSAHLAGSSRVRPTVVH